MVANGSPKRAFLSLRGSPAFIFRILLGAIILSTAMGVVYAVTNRSAFLQSFPGAASPGAYAGLLLIAVLGVVALIALWSWRRWGLVLYGFVVIGSLALDRMARAPLAHEVTVCVAAVAVFSLAYLNRTRFAASERSNSH